MPVNLIENNIEYGEVKYEWDFPEFVPYERGKWWYVIAGIVIAGFIVFAITTLNLLFGILVIMVSMVLFYLQNRHPKILNVKFTDMGMVIENLFYSYDEIRSFWIVSDNEEGNNVYFEFQSFSIPRLSIPFIDIDPVRLQAYLAQFIDIDPEREGTPLSETFARWLRL